MNYYKANRAIMTVIALAALGSCGLVATASAQNLTVPAETDVRAFEPPIDVTPGQFATQGFYGRPDVFVGRSVSGRRGFIAGAPGYDDDR